MKQDIHILIVKLSAIGDVIHALPVAHALKTGLPACRITWVVEKAASDLVRANSYIDEVIVFDKPKCKTLSGMSEYAPGFVAGLRKRRFDISLDLQGLFKSGIISFLSGASRRLVYCNARELSDWMGTRVCGDHQHGHIVEQYLDVARALGVQAAAPDFGLTVSDEVTTKAEQTAAFAGLDCNKQYVVLVPGANWPNKRWPITHFAQLTDKLFAVGLIPVLVGGPGDDYLASEITRAAEIPPIDLTGKTSLLELAHIIRRSGAVVGGDTGPVHLAAALKRPIVMLMGPTDKIRNGPYGKGHVILTIPDACAGCWKRECAQKRDCLQSIDSENVFQAVTGLLELHRR